MTSINYTFSPFLIGLTRPNSLIKKVALVFGASIILAIAANISIPLKPIPLTFQSLIVLLIGAMLGRKLGPSVILLTIALGFLGLPMFANGNNSYVALSGPSAGYIYGYIAASYIAGFAAEKGMDRKFLSGILMFAIAHQVLFIFGVLYLSFYLNCSLQEAFKLGYIPFMFFDAAKFTLATLIMFGLWKAVKQTHKI